MRVVLAMMLQLLELCIIFLSVAVPRSKGSTISPSPAFLPVIPSLGSNAPSLPLLPHGLVVPPSPARGSWTNIAPSSPAVANGSFLLPPDALPLPASAPTPQKHHKDIEPSSTPSPTTIVLSPPPHEAVPLPSTPQGNAPLPLRSSPPLGKAPAEHGTLAPNIGNGNANMSHTEEPVSPSPAATPSINLPKISPSSQPTDNGSFPPQEGTKKGHSSEPVTPESSASPPWKAEHNPSPPPPEAHPINPSILPAPIASPASSFPLNPPPVHPIIPSTLPAPVASPKSSPSGSFNWKNGDAPPITVPLYKSPKPLPAVVHSPAQAPAAHKARQIDHDPEPLTKTPNKEKHTPALSPSASSHEHHHTRNTTSSSAPPPPSPYMVSSSPSNHQDKAIPPSLQPESGHTHHVSPPMNQSFSNPSFSSPTHSPMTQVSSAPSPSIELAPHPTEMQAPFLPPKVSPSPSKTPSPPQVRALPPPPPNEECSSTVCLEPYTNSPPGAPCRCVWPMRVGLRVSVSLYTFFPLVSELASEIATGVFMKQSQVRIMGANAATEQPEKTVVLIDLVPLGENFDSTTALFTSNRFWHKQVAIKASYFGDYDVLYVSYPGLAPSPPLPPSTISIIDGGPYSIDGNNGGTIKPLGVDIQKRQHKSGLSRGIVAIITVSVFLAVVLCAAAAAAWVMLKYGDHVTQPASTPRLSQPSLTKPPGNAASLVGGGVGSTSTSFRSSIAAYTGSAKTFSANDIIKATDNFHGSRILGEGGFGLVYGGILEDGTKVAVKVIKREDHHGDREFLAEVEMLSRLHHRNLVKLIGICTEESVRCLIYELVPNGSVESHLHGVDRESSPLGWSARMKIALGAARGLAYLHEDSSPRVIHRDFKSSNILLEDDFTPKVSDFGLARTATDENNNRHISTRVMGTFGYVAPKYAMTGHLLVKSDVYSYGVVLLELLTGRKPVDMSQPPGQENLVAWARPLLASREGLEAIVDPYLGGDVSFDSVAKVAAIASMCVQPEVSNRPFMGEVVQALKLVCNECEEAKEEGEAAGSRRSSTQDMDLDLDVRVSNVSEIEFSGGVDVERGLVASELFSCSVRLGRQEEESGSFRRHSYSGPLMTGRSRQLWQIMRRLSGGTVSEHGSIFKL